MKPIRLSVCLSKIKGSRLVQFPNEENKKETYVCVPLSRCFVPKDAPSAHLLAMMIETPNSIYSDFVVKEYIPQNEYENLSKEQRNAIPALGRGKLIAERPNKVLISNTESVEEVTDVAVDDLPF